MTAMKHLLAAIWIVLSFGCKPQTSASGGGAGKERGPCYGNKTCDQGLVCLSDLCVRPPGADCAKVAEHLSFMMLGNYAPREERAAFVSTTEGDCVKLGLTKEEGDCILRAEHRQQLAQCPKKLGVGDCAKIVAHLKSLLPKGGTEEFLVTPADKLISRCKNETPSLALEQCALAATKVEDVERCSW
jgi:hypothetical protein